MALEALAASLSFSEHSHHHRPKCSVLLAVDQQLGEGATLRLAPELADPVGSLEVGQHEHVEQLGAGSGPEGIQALPEARSGSSGLMAAGYAVEPSVRVSACLPRYISEHLRMRAFPSRCVRP
jgi:hypothetical protein